MRPGQPFSSERLYLGWRFALAWPDPGPRPRRPAPSLPAQLSEGWLAAQRREEQRLSRPARLACGSCLVLAGVAAAAGFAVPSRAALSGVSAALLTGGAVASGAAIRRGQRALRQLVAAEQQRVALLRDAAARQLTAGHDEYATRMRVWQAARAAFDRQPRWYAVSLPTDIDRIDLAGGTLPGWSAIVTVFGMARLAAGAELTILDLTEGAVAAELAGLCRRCGLEPEPLVWVLPADLPRLDLGAGLARQPMAEVLSAAVSAADGRPGPEGQPWATGPAGAAADAALLERVLGILGGETRLSALTAGLRVLAQVASHDADIAAGVLTAGQFDALAALFGRGAADRVVVHRAFELESRLRWLERLATDPDGIASLPPSRLRVLSLDRRAGPAGNGMLAGYLAAALSHVLRQARPGRPAANRWAQTLVVLGAERLPGQLVDRLTDACETSGTGLLIGYRSIPTPVRDRLGRGNTACAFMRLGNHSEARVASDQIGTEHRFVIAQLTDSVGASVTDSTGDSYTSTVGRSGSASDTASVTETAGQSASRGRTRRDPFAPFGEFTRSRGQDRSRSSAVSDSRAITEGISSGTSWGLSTSRAVAASRSAGRTAQRSRELLVEPHELQRLPVSAVIVSYSSGTGREVVLADANPAIVTLPGVTSASLEDVLGTGAPSAGAAFMPS
jgi:hypothetical protein